MDMYLPYDPAEIIWRILLETKKRINRYKLLDRNPL